MVSERSQNGREPGIGAAAPVVSVIIPSYNCERYIEECLASVLAQTFRDIEVIVVDDASTDGTLDVLRPICETDDRVTLLERRTNGGVARARNAGLARATGRYVAYLDSDDVWFREKLESQLEFMDSFGLSVCVTSYETIEESGAHRNYVYVPDCIDYKGFLKNTLTCSSTILVDLSRVDRDLLVMPDLRRGQDAATWLRVLRSGHVIHGHQDVLVQYRKRAGSLSSSAWKSIQRTWRVYRKAEGLSVPFSAYCLVSQVLNAVAKRLPSRADSAGPSSGQL